MAAVYRRRTAGENSGMGTQKKQAKKSPVTAKRTARPKKTGRRGRQKAAELVEQVLSKIEQKITADEIKPTVGDYLRLLQYREEIQDTEQPKEIRVTWVDPQTAESER
jgi:hypothetical protein